MCEYDTSTAVRQWLYTAPKFINLMTFTLLLVLLGTLIGRDSLFGNDITQTITNKVTNLYKQPINEIIITSEPECPSGFEKVLLGNWAGTNQGCYDTITQWIDNKTCPKSSTTTQNISPIKPKELNVWNKNAICIQRTKTVYYLRNETECPSGLIKCSLDACIDPSEAFPIISAQVMPYDSQEELQTNEINFSEGKKLVYKRSSETQPGDFFTQVQISLYNAPCLDPNRTPLSGTKPPYILSLAPSPGCQKLGNIHHLALLETLPVKTVLEDNGVSSTKLDSVPQLNDYLEGEEAYLAVHKKYTIKGDPVCHLFDGDTITRLSYYEDKFIEHTWPVVIILLLASLGSIVTIAGEVYLRTRSKDEERIMLRLVAYLNIGLLGFIFFLYIVNGYIGFDAQGDIGKEFHLLKEIRDAGCFLQEEMGVLLEEFIKEISGDMYVIFALDYTLALIALLGFLLLGILTVADISGVKKLKTSQTLNGKDKKKKNKKYDNIKNKGNIELLLQNKH